MGLDGLVPRPTPPRLASWRRHEAEFRRAAWNSWPSQVRCHPRHRIPVVVSAPHAGPQMRNGWPKPADIGTGGLAEALAQALGCSSIAVCGVQRDDPNWDLNIGSYKRALHALMKPEDTVIDVHAMRREHGVDICIGTGRDGDLGNCALALQICRLAQAHGLRAVLDQPFPARNPGTVTCFAQRLGHRALQIEINAALLDLEGNPAGATQLLRFMTDVVELAASGRDQRRRG